MEDLFPETWLPESLGADAIPCLWVTFFAIYPATRDLPRVVDWQRRICSQEAAAVDTRLPEILHVSVAECGKPKQRRQPLPNALAEAAHHFSFPAFELVFDSVARFGREGQACVAIADAESQEKFADLRIALANAQRHAGIFVSRAKCEAHLTLGYGNRSPMERRSIEPFGFRVAAIEYVASEQGKSHHEHLVRWALTQSR
ncbi:MAG TPA: 2'-5' RNA ligase family protein [Rhodanobacteraceae bacterium]|nr:2'-5' RNA ligase family protein [Rhodanobacteraceae bacterium]